jgi:hypothetical protein
LFDTRVEANSICTVCKDQGIAMLSFKDDDIQEIFAALPDGPLYDEYDNLLAASHTKLFTMDMSIAIKTLYSSDSTLFWWTGFDRVNNCDNWTNVNAMSDAGVLSPNHMEWITGTTKSCKDKGLVLCLCVEEGFL